MARLLNSQCDFENGFFSCDLPEDTVLLILKVKTKTGNHTLVEDTEKQTEKFCPWKKPSKKGKQFPQKLPGVLTPKKSDISVTSDSGPCPSPIEHEYRPKYFDEPECLDSDKENMPPIESITPPSLKNLSLEEENNDDGEHEATSWEANVARNLDLLPRSSSPYPKKKTRTLEDLETDTDDNMVDMTNFFDRPQIEKRSPRPKQIESNSENCPTPQNSPTHMAKPPVLAIKPHRNEVWGILPDKRRVPSGWPACLRRQPPRVAFRNNDIYVVEDEDYEEPRERQPKVQYKLKIADNPAAQNMPHEEDYSDNNYESIDETAI